MHDLLSRRTFYALLGMHNISDYHWHQASLPIRFGGFGLRPVADISSSAFVASWAFFLSAFPDRFPLLHPKIGDLLEDEASNDSLLRFHLHTAVDQLKSITKEGQEPYTLRSLQEHPRKLQHRLSARIGEILAEKCLHESFNDEDAARLRSLTGTGWLEAIPSSSRLALQSQEFRLAAYLRLGLPLLFPRLDVCDCGKRLDDKGFHFITCKFGGGPVWSYDRIVDGWCEHFRELGLHYKREERDRYVSNQNRPDIVLYHLDA